MIKSTFDLKFLGTGAADFSPLLKTEYKEKFGLDARRSSSILLNGHILIDSGVHTYESLEIIGADISKITDIFISHLHMDHFRPQVIEKIASFTKKPIKLWLPEGSIGSEHFAPSLNTEIILMKNFETYYTSCGIKVSPIPANHSTDHLSRHFIFEKDNKKFFYGLDGAWFLFDSYYFMQNMKLDLMILDSTCGDYEGDFRMAEHNSIPMIKLMLPSLKTMNIIDEKSRIILSHVAPTLNKPHIETEKIVSEFGAILAFDGMEFSL